MARNYRANASCGGMSFSTGLTEFVPSDNKFAIATYRPERNGTLETNPTYGAMQSCCGGNNVTKLDIDCALWCDVPSQYVDDTDGFHDCWGDAHPTSGFMVVVNATDEQDGGDGDGDGGGGGDDDDSAGAATAGRPNLLGVGVLALMVGYFCMLS